MASEDVREVVPEIVATMSNATYKGEKGTFNDLTPEQKESLRGPRGYQGPQGDTGPKGATGPQGEQGPAGVDGEDGITPEITVLNITGGHTISISYGVEDPRNSSFNVMDGTNGSNGSAGQNGSDGITPTITVTSFDGGHTIDISYGVDDPRNTSFDILDGTQGTEGGIGPDGPAGADGADGITPDITVTSITGGHTVTIDYGSGDSRNTSFNVMDGAAGATGSNGTNGTNGTDGITPTVAITAITGGHNVAFDYGTGDARNTNFDVMDGSSASLTAGTNITIDSNGVISAGPSKLSDPIWWILNSQWVTNFSTGGFTVAQSFSDFVTALKRNGIVYADYSTLGFWSPKTLNDALGTQLPCRRYRFNASNADPVSDTYYAWNDTNDGFGRYNSMFIMASNQIMGFYDQDGVRDIIGYNLAGLLRIKTNGASNYTSLSLPMALRELDTAISNVSGGASLPSDPSSDGTYVLTNTVASGSATQSWETASSGGGSSYTAGDGISIDSNNVISADANPLIHSMLQMTTAGNNMPLVVKLGNDSTWEQFVDNIKAGKVVYVSTSTSYTLSGDYKLTPALLGVSNLYAMNLDGMSVPTMSSSVASYPATGTQVGFSTYYYFDGAFLWSWKNPEDFGNFIKVRYKTYKNYALGKALADINTDISAKFTAPTAPSADGDYSLNCSVASGTPTYAWGVQSSGGGSSSSGPAMKTIYLNGSRNNRDNQKTAIANIPQADYDYLINFLKAEYTTAGSGMDNYPLQIMLNGEKAIMSYIGHTTELYGRPTFMSWMKYNNALTVIYLYFTVTYNDGEVNGVSRYDIMYARPPFMSGETVWNTGYDYGISADSVVYYNSKPYFLSTLLNTYNTKLPDLPSNPTDGTYALIATVSSGAVSYSWESISLS